MLDFVNKYLLGVTVPILLICVGIYFTLYLRGFHIFKTAKIFKILIKKKTPEGISPFRALTLALAGTLGVGNIVGVSAAIAVGGFGSVFWMWISALCAMVLKYAEVVLAMRHRRVDDDGSLHGSAMYYINDVFSHIHLKKTGALLSSVFALFCLMNALTMGGMIQSNAVSEALNGVFNITPIACGAIISLLIFLIISIGSKMISKLTEILVPLMSVGYIVISLAVIIIRREAVPEALMSIFKDAFSAKAALGGGLGFIFSNALRYGCMRGLISNEAGCGTAPMAHSAPSSNSPAEQGVYGIVEVFVDTILLCTMTALVVIINYDGINTDIGWLMMTFEAYKNTLGEFAVIFLAISVLCFGFATILCWGHYGTEAMKYFSKKKISKRLFIIAYSVSVFSGAVFASELIWSLADLAIGAMSVINITVLLIGKKEIKEETDYYFFAENKNKYNKNSKNAKNITKSVDKSKTL